MHILNEIFETRAKISYRVTFYKVTEKWLYQQRLYNNFNSYYKIQAEIELKAMEPVKDLVIRKATKDDMGAVAEMIQELADFEKMSNGPQLTVKDLQRDGFEKEPPAFSCLVAELPSQHRVIGYALYFPTYSTWRGASMMLEDLYVRPTERKRGVGDKLFDAVAAAAWGAGCARLDFHVLKWNPARSFYHRKGALDLTAAEGWCYYRLPPPAERAPVPPKNGRGDSN